MKSAAEFKCRNGDDLADLNSRKSVAEQRLSRARSELHLKEQEMKPLREAVACAEGEVMNLSSRLNTWWSEFKEHQRQRKRA